MKLATDAQGRTHRISWWVWSGGEKIRHTATMRGHWPGWDATCSCGWDSRTGGAIKASVQRDVDVHKWEHGVHPLQQRMGSS